jgi:fucose 4-O-acetylase-like acetyltransferase
MNSVTARSTAEFCEGEQGASRPRIHETWPDIAKGIGILLVVYGHVARGVEKAGLPIDKNFFEVLDALVYAFHMPLFFFVSGYLFWGSVAARGFRSVLPSRLALLLWLYVIWSLGHGAIEVLLGRLTNGNLQWAEVFALWQPRAHFWHLYALALLVLVTAAFAWVPDRYRALALFACSTALYTAPGLGTGWYPLLVVCWFLVYFAAGFLMASHRFKRDSIRSHAWMALLFWVAMCIAWVAAASQDLLLRLVFSTVGIGLVGSVSVLLAKYTRKVSRGLAFLGSIALPIYLAHILAGSGVRIVLQKMLGIDAVWLHLLMGVGSGVLLPWALWMLTTRWRTGGWLWALPKGRKAGVRR